MKNNAFSCVIRLPGTCLPIIVCLLMLMPAGRISAQQNHTDQPSSYVPKNIIVMIADGAGFSTLQATRYYTGKPLPYDADDWVKLAMTTYSLSAGEDRSDQDPERVYNPAKSWDTRPAEGYRKQQYPYYFEGYKWHMNTYPDSAATMSAMMTGERVPNGSLNMKSRGEPLVSVAELAHRDGKLVGAITTVEFVDATPASGSGVHIRNRRDYSDIAQQMLNSGIASFIGGAGNPDYDNNGKPFPETLARDYQFVGGKKAWEQLKEGSHPQKWLLVESRQQLNKLATEPADQIPDRPIIYVAPVHNKFQVFRYSNTDMKTASPGEDKKNQNVASLSELSAAALNVLGRNPDGFFLMIEGGAIDIAMHQNAMGRMIEEYIDFSDAVQTVTEYLDDNNEGNNWDNTLVIVTADHDHLLLGPESDKIPYQPLEDRGAGNMPGYKWLYNSHSNLPVPWFAKGVGAKQFVSLAKQVDHHESDGKTYGYGPYFHQIDMGKQLMAYLSQPKNLSQTSPHAPPTASGQ